MWAHNLIVFFYPKPTQVLWLSGKESACQCKRFRFDSWVRKIPWRRKWQPTQYSCWENAMDRGICWAIFNGVTKSRTQLSAYTHTHTHTHTQLSLQSQKSSLKWKTKHICLFLSGRDHIHSIQPRQILSSCHLTFWVLWLFFWPRYLVVWGSFSPESKIQFSTASLVIVFPFKIQITKREAK